jgi:DNA-binding response OmpR family regulator
MSAPLILIVEDEPTIANAIARRLLAEGYRAQTVGDGLEAVVKTRDLQADLVVLDVMLPGIDGLEVCRRIQAERPVPVLMLTARDDETDKLVGLGVGADDYMTKPFSMRELLARIKALLRRVERAQMLGVQPGDDTPIRAADLVIDRAARRVTRGSEQVHLTPTEFDLLVFLAASPHTVLTREKLLEHVWDWADASATRTVDSHIKALRRKLGSDLIRTVHGVGYAFEPNGPQADNAAMDDAVGDRPAHRNDPVSPGQVRSAPTAPAEFRKPARGPLYRSRRQGRPHRRAR